MAASWLDPAPFFTSEWTCSLAASRSQLVTRRAGHPKGRVASATPAQHGVEGRSGTTGESRQPVRFQLAVSSQSPDSRLRFDR